MTKCAECGKPVSLDTGYAEYQHGIDKEGKPLTHAICIECDGKEEPQRDPDDMRREKLTKELCRLMNWKYKTGLVYAGLRKAAMAQAVVIGLDKLEEIIARLSK